MKKNPAIFATLLGGLWTLAACAQTPAVAPAPPLPATPASQTAPPLPGTPGTYSSRVSAIVYGLQGEVQAFVLRDGVSVTLPPDLGSRLQSQIIRGTRVQVSGLQRVIAGQINLMAQSITANGQTLIATATGAPDPRGDDAGAPPPPPPPDAGGPPPPHTPQM